MGCSWVRGSQWLVTRIHLDDCAQLPSADPARVLACMSGQSVWSAMVRGRNIKAGDVLVCVSASSAEAQGEQVHMEAHVEAKSGADAMVRLRWDSSERSLNLAQVLHMVGNVPLPPYMKREADSQDLDSYQTPHASCQGSVAAPTAGLHFSRHLVARMLERGVSELAVTLHVGAGTFRPVDSASTAHHVMHAEWISLPVATLAGLRKAVADQRPIVPVGTTSVRTLESVYWWGVKLLLNDSVSLSNPSDTLSSGLMTGESGEGGEERLQGSARGAFEMAVSQWDPYRLTHQVF